MTVRTAGVSKFDSGSGVIHGLAMVRLPNALALASSAENIAPVGWPGMRQPTELMMSP